MSNITKSDCANMRLNLTLSTQQEQAYNQTINMHIKLWFLMLYFFPFVVDSL